MASQKSQVLPIDMGMVRAFIVRGESPILVDTGNPGREEVILNHLAGWGIEPESISLILLTHGHLDHAGSVTALKERTGAPVAMGRLDAEALGGGAHPPVRPLRLLGWLLRPLLSLGSVSQIPPFEPDILIDGEMDLLPFGVAGRVIPTPGHSPGSVSVVLAGGEVIVGDLIMGGFVRHRRPGYPLFADDLDQLRESLRAVMRLAPRRIWTAHGGPLEPEVVLRRFPWAREA